MKLVLYSGGCAVANAKMDQEFKALLRKKKNPRITFIPSCSWGSELYFKEFCAHYQAVGIRKIEHFPIDMDFSQKELRRALSSDAIYLSGGNTFYFLKYLREKGLLEKLKKFVARGGVLMGLSAGSIIMTPSIAMAAVPKFDRDSNDVQLKNIRSLGLVRFEFYPHYNRRKKVDMELLRYSKKVKHPLYACTDGDGIIVDGPKKIFIGKVYTFYRGRKFLAN